jgi:mono/diheme cytochrome c family protein
MRIHKWLKVSTAVFGAVCALGAGVFAYASQASRQALAVPSPNVTADRSPAGVARGATIFHATCEACHRPPGGERASGAPLLEAPDWLGRLHSANITADPRAGVGGVDDAVLARTIRYGVSRSRRWIPMPAYAMSDADLSAVLGFMRSSDGLFAADPRPAPASRVTSLGKVALLLGGVFEAPSHAAAIQAPPRAASVDYGRYLAEGVYQCGDCHTPGFSADKVRGPDAYAGGAELKNAAGETVLSPNLTRHEVAGIGRWSRDQFALAVRSGVRPDGAAIGSPMPHYRGADDVEIDALWAYLRSLPPRAEPVGGRRPAVVVNALGQRDAAGPERNFQRLGCAGCHAAGAPYAEKLALAAGKPSAEVARWIRSPEQFLPGTVMPSFAAVLDEPSALELAVWIQQGPRP